MPDDGHAIGAIEIGDAIYLCRKMDDIMEMRVGKSLLYFPKANTTYLSIEKI